VQNIVDGVTSALPIPMTEEDRQALLHGGIENGVRTGNGVNDRIERKFEEWGNRAQAALDPKAQAIGAAAEEAIAHGGGKARKAAVETGKNAVASGIASTRNAVNAMTGSEAPKVTAEEVRAELHEAKETMENAIETAAQEVQEHVVDPVKNTAQKATQAVKNSAVGQAATEFKEGFREGYRGDAGGQPTTPTVASSSQPQTEQNSPSAAQEVTPVVLNNSGEVLDPFQNLENPIGTVRKMAQSNITAPTEAAATTRENTAAGSNPATESDTGKMRIIIKKAGEKTGKGAKIVMRQVKKEMQQTKKDAQGALGLMGKGIKGAGDWLKKQPAKKAAERRAQGEESLWAKWNAIGEQARLEKEAKEDLERELNSEYNTGES
jgi:chaperonin cofactor prefoldin